MERGRFDREIAVLLKIESKWIVHLLDAGETDDVRYYVMDFVEGVHLDKFMLSSDRSLVEKLTTFECVCRAVADAHTCGVVHRDLKPQNIIIDKQGQPRILDFGICTVEWEDWSSVGGPDVRGTLTHPGDVIGTLKYMSPEQAWGGVVGNVDERSDIWSLGIMLHEIVSAGKYPYSLAATPEKPAPEALLERIRKELPCIENFAALPRGRDLETLLHRCLAWERSQRLTSADLLADDLARYGRGERIVTRPLSIRHRVKRLAVGAAARSRAMFMIVFVGMVGAIIWLSTALFNVGWMVTGQAYAGTSPGGDSAAVAVGSALDDGILIVGISDDTIGEVIEYARRNDLDGVTQSLQTWRPLYGRLMSRMAGLSEDRTTPRAVVWDYYFQTEQPGDAELVAGIHALEKVGTPVNLAARTFEGSGSPFLSSKIVTSLGPSLRVGAIVGRDMVRRPGDFVIAFRDASGAEKDALGLDAGQADHATVPSLGLVTLVSLLHPNATLEIEWQHRRRHLDLLYARSPGAYLRERDRMDVSKVFMTNTANPTVQRESMLACTTFSLAPPQRWRDRTVPFEDVLRASKDELAAHVNDKIIVFGDLRAPRFGFAADRHRVKYGSKIEESVPGCYLLGDLITGLLNRRYIRSAFVLPPEVFVTLLFLAVVGALAPLRLANQRAFEEPKNRQLLYGAASILVLGSYAALLFSRDAAMVHAGMVGFAVLLPMAGSFWVEFTRNRHRILERNRRRCLSLNADSSGTITLASRPRKS
jgi:hypothetical protein